MFQRLRETTEQLSVLAQAHESVLVSFSGGKDSWVVLDLCAKAFKRVEAMFLFLVPGLEQCEEQLCEAESRYKIQIRREPHWILASDMARGLYCDPLPDRTPKLKRLDLYYSVMKETGCALVVTGEKRSDALWRRMQMKEQRSSSYCMPIADWSQDDVLAYVKHIGVKPHTAQSTTARPMGGVEMRDDFLCWCFEHYPEDFRRIEEWFPYVKAAVKRREWYGRVAA